MIASIALPRNTFFNTAQLTYILALEKRHSANDPRPEVFCGIARTIGETLNWERVPTPEDNDLADIAKLFVRHVTGDAKATKGSSIAKVVAGSSFTENDRWDVSRFWNEEELVALGQRESAVSRVDFIDEAKTELEEIVAELSSARAEIVALTSGPVITVKLNDIKSFDVRSGTRVTGKEIREHLGKLPIYSCFRTELEIKGHVDEKFFETIKKGTVENKTVGKAIVTVNANGASVGHVYVRRDRCGLTDDVIIVELKRPDIDYDYLAVALQAAVDKGGFLYEAKLFVTRAKDLEIDVPGSDGKLDLEQQRAIARAVRRFDALRTRLHDLGVRSGTVRAV